MLEKLVQCCAHVPEAIACRLVAAGRCSHALIDHHVIQLMLHISRATHRCFLASLKLPVH